MCVLNTTEKEVAGKLLVLVKEDGEIKGKPSHATPSLQGRCLESKTLP